MKLNQVRYLIGLFIFMFTASALTVVLTNQQARAGSSGCVQIGDFGTAVSCINVIGKGLSVDEVDGSFAKPSEVCNWRYDIVYTDTDNKAYRTERGPTNEGCIGKGEFVMIHKPTYRAKTGGVCAKLFENGEYRDAACESIFP
jgi:hypothetical protein